MRAIRKSTAIENLKYACALQKKTKRRKNLAEGFSEGLFFRYCASPESVITRVIVSTGLRYSSERAYNQRMHQSLVILIIILSSNY